MDELLKDICQKKKCELEMTKSKCSFQTLEKLLPKKNNRGLKKILNDSQKNKNINIIAEIKKASPSAGEIIKEYVPEDIATQYEKSGAGAISILTESSFFKGNIEHLSTISQKTNIPLLRKDFIIDEYQILESKIYKADAILLIASVLNDKQIIKFIKIADEIGLDCIIETHSENELKRAINIDYPIIGINNRNLNNFTVDINNTLKLIKKVPNDFTIVGESGIKKFQDIRLYNDAGVYNFLIGESILTSKNIQKKFDELLNK